ncbi:hypothetical protein [Streptomyces fuscigenes]|uniref:hypothetical protein n=1 Tax=Streptomyces fuscigenes TaxID=1528880 RepID=UPI001F33B945|nr:hypothetical protein [Streptomyces fuscigenes]MCF3962101.1 hypothetical protein [Streptomyces fuscigenes]
MSWHRAGFFAAVGLGGAVLSTAQWMAVLVALFSGAGAIVAVSCATAGLGVAVLAAVGTTGRAHLPLLNTRAGLWGWAAAVHVGGTAGALGLLVLGRAPGSEPGLPGLFAGAAACSVLTAAAFLPGVRARLTVLAAALALVGTAATAAWAAARPPTTAEWLADHHVDRRLLMLGAPPAGYRRTGIGASDQQFTAVYGSERAGGGALRLTVRRISYEDERTAANGCPVPYGRRAVCAGDGGGRQRVRYGQPDASGVAVVPDGVVPPGAVDELRLRRAGFVYVVADGGGGGLDLRAARHLLATLRPATASELAPLPRRR